MTKENNQKIYNRIECEILHNPDIPEEIKRDIMANIAQIKAERLNILITGATGSGKSSTINALFNTEVAKVGVGVDPETMEIERYELGNMTLWDSPGLGDGKEADNRHARNIIAKLNELDEDGNALIDLVIVILDGSSRDMGTSYELINKVIIPNLGENNSSRLLVAINQADMAMKGRGWDVEHNEPMPTLKEFLEEKVDSVKRRILEATGVRVNPIYYSAGFKEAGMQQAPYNLSKLLYLIVQATPDRKRIIYVDNLNSNPEMWRQDDGLKDYREETQRSFTESLTKALTGAYEGYKIGERIGSVLGPVGKVAGGIIGGLIGGICGFFS